MYKGMLRYDTTINYIRYTEIAAIEKELNEKTIIITSDDLNDYALKSDRKELPTNYINNESLTNTLNEYYSKNVVNKKCVMADKLNEYEIIEVAIYRSKATETIPYIYDASYIYC